MFSIDTGNEDPEVAANRSEFGDLSISYVDSVAHDYEHLVKESATFIRSLPGVEDVSHVDRELVRVWAENLDIETLRRALRRWWLEHLPPDSPIREQFR